MLSDLNQKWNVSTNYSEITQYRILWKSVQRVSSCIWTDEQTDIAKLIGVLLQRLNTKTVKNQSYVETGAISNQNSLYSFYFVKL